LLFLVYLIQNIQIGVSKNWEQFLQVEAVNSKRKWEQSCAFHRGNSIQQFADPKAPS